jgi:hypothetical protein
VHAPVNGPLPLRLPQNTPEAPGVHAQPVPEGSFEMQAVGVEVGGMEASVGVRVRVKLEVS